MFLGILGLLCIVFLLLILDSDYQTIILSEDDKQSIKPQKEFDSKIDSAHYFLLLKEFKKYKTLAKGFKFQCLLALSYYLKLKEIP